MNNFECPRCGHCCPQQTKKQWVGLTDEDRNNARSGVMKPEPFAWAYQNANTEHQYLVWHKQEGGRNWMPLFTQTDVQEAILAEREVIAQSLDKQADLAGDPMDREWAQEMAAAVRARGEKI